MINSAKSGQTCWQKQNWNFQLRISWNKIFWKMPFLYSMPQVDVTVPKRTRVRKVIGDQHMNCCRYFYSRLWRHCILKNSTWALSKLVSKYSIYLVPLPKMPKQRCFMRDHSISANKFSICASLRCFQKCSCFIPIPSSPTSVPF